MELGLQRSLRYFPVQIYTQQLYPINSFLLRNKTPDLLLYIFLLLQNYPEICTLNMIFLKLDEFVPQIDELIQRRTLLDAFIDYLHVALTNTILNLQFKRINCQLHLLMLLERILQPIKSALVKYLLHHFHLLLQHLKLESKLFELLIMLFRATITHQQLLIYNIDLILHNLNLVYVLHYLWQHQRGLLIDLLRNQIRHLRKIILHLNCTLQPLHLLLEPKQRDLDIFDALNVQLEAELFQGLTQVPVLGTGALLPSATALRVNLVLHF